MQKIGWLLCIIEETMKSAMFYPNGCCPADVRKCNSTIDSCWERVHSCKMLKTFLRRRNALIHRFPEKVIAEALIFPAELFVHLQLRHKASVRNAACVKIRRKLLFHKTCHIVQWNSSECVMKFEKPVLEFNVSRFHSDTLVGPLIYQWSLLFIWEI